MLTAAVPRDLERYAGDATPGSPSDRQPETRRLCPAERLEEGGPFRILRGGPEPWPERFPGNSPPGRDSPGSDSAESSGVPFLEEWLPGQARDAESWPRPFMIIAGQDRSRSWGWRRRSDHFSGAARFPGTVLGGDGRRGRICFVARRASTRQGPTRASPDII